MEYTIGIDPKAYGRAFLRLKRKHDEPGPKSVKDYDYELQVIIPVPGKHSIKNDKPCVSRGDGSLFRRPKLRVEYHLEKEGTGTDPYFVCHTLKLEGKKIKRERKIFVTVHPHMKDGESIEVKIEGRLNHKSGTTTHHGDADDD